MILAKEKQQSLSTLDFSRAGSEMLKIAKAKSPSLYQLYLVVYAFYNPTGCPL